MVPARQAQRTNQGRTPSICILFESPFTPVSTVSRATPTPLWSLWFDMWYRTNFIRISQFQVWNTVVFYTGKRSFFLTGAVGTVFFFGTEIFILFLFIFPLQMSSLSLSQSHHQHEVFTQGKYRSVHSFTQSCGSAFSIFKRTGTSGRISDKMGNRIWFYIITIPTHT
jgi:hypothetical protein